MPWHLATNTPYATYAYWRIGVSTLHSKCTPVGAIHSCRMCIQYSHVSRVLKAPSMPLLVGSRFQLLFSLAPYAEEARSLASQFNGICRKMFPTAELANTVCRQHSASMQAPANGQQHSTTMAEDRQHAIKHAM